MKKVVILGGGFAGLHIFYKIRHLAGKKIDLTVIDSRKFSLLKPSLPEVALEGATLSHSLIDLEHAVTSYGARFIEDEVVSLQPENSRIILKDHMSMEYDYLFITVGAVKDYDAIKGYDEFGYSVCDDTQALKLWQRLKEFKGGKIVTGAAKSSWGTRVKAPSLVAPCEGPIGEIMFMTDHYLDTVKGMKRGEDYTIDAFTPGEIFFEDVGDTPRNLVGKYMSEKGINLHKKRLLSEIGKDFIAFEDGSKMESDLSIIIPPYVAAKFLQESDISDEMGFVPTDDNMRHLDYANIFSAGDINALAQPKLGHIAIIQGAVAAAAFMKDIGEDTEIPKYEPEVFCIMNMGGYNGVLISSNVLYGKDNDIAFFSPLAKMMKWGFDNYLYYSKGHMPPDFALDATDKLVKIFAKK